MSPARLAELDALFEARAGTEAGNAGAELLAEVRRLQLLLAQALANLAVTSVLDADAIADEPALRVPAAFY